jgi:hypothetical protein
MPSAILIVKLATANLANATRRYRVIAERPMFESIYASKPSTLATSQRPVSRHVASARARRMIAEPPLSQSIYAFKPQGTIAFSNRSSPSIAYATKRSSNYPFSSSIPNHQVLDSALD